MSSRRSVRVYESSHRLHSRLSDLELAHAFGWCLAGESEMRPPMVVFVLPAAEFGGQLTRCAECRPAIKLLPIRAVASFDFAVYLRAAWRDVLMRDAEVAEMPGEVGAEFAAVVGLYPLNRHRKPLPDLVDEGDGVRDRTVRVDPEDSVAGGLVDRRELVKAAAAEFQMLHIDLDGLAGHGEFAPTARPWAIPFHRDARHAMPLEDLVDRRDRYIGLMEALEIETNTDWPILALRTDAEERATMWGGVAR